jgi:hypothetical protein
VYTGRAARSNTFSPIYTPGVNLVRAAFLDPGVRELYGDGWLKTARTVVAHLPTQVGAQPEDLRLERLVGALSVHSEEHRRMWARHDVQPRASGGSTTIEHRRSGGSSCATRSWRSPGGEGVTLVLSHAEARRSSARSLQLPASIAEPASAGSPDPDDRRSPDHRTRSVP